MNVINDYPLIAAYLHRMDFQLIEFDKIVGGTGESGIPYRIANLLCDTGVLHLFSSLLANDHITHNVLKLSRDERARFNETTEIDETIIAKFSIENIKIDKLNPSLIAPVFIYNPLFFTGISDKSKHFEHRVGPFYREYWPVAIVLSALLQGRLSRNKKKSSKCLKIIERIFVNPDLREIKSVRYLYRVRLLQNIIIEIGKIADKHKIPRDKPRYPANQNDVIKRALTVLDDYPIFAKIQPAFLEKTLFIGASDGLKTAILSIGKLDGDYQEYRKAYESSPKFDVDAKFYRKQYNKLTRLQKNLIKVRDLHVLGDMICNLANFLCLSREEHEKIRGMQGFN